MLLASNNDLLVACSFRIWFAVKYASHQVKDRSAEGEGYPATQSPSELRQQSYHCISSASQCDRLYSTGIHDSHGQHDPVRRRDFVPTSSCCHQHQQRRSRFSVGRDYVPETDAEQTDHIEQYLKLSHISEWTMFPLSLNRQAAHKSAYSRADRKREKGKEYQANLTIGISCSNDGGQSADITPR